MSMGRQQTPVDFSMLEDGAKQRSRLLYGMLNGLLYERRPPPATLCAESEWLRGLEVAEQGPDA